MNGRIFLTIGIFLFEFNSSFGQRKEEFKSYFRISNISYTENKTARENQMDVYMPKKGSKSPVIIWIHGGDWISGDKSDIGKQPEYFTSKGYIFIAINYRLYPKANHSVQVQDVANAIVWVSNNIIHYSGDKDKIFLMGHETGANLAAMVVVQSKYLLNASGSRNMIKGIVTVQGEGFDIPAVLPNQHSKFQDACDVVIGKTKKEWIEASPVTHIKKGTLTTPIMIVYGDGKSPSELDARMMIKKLKSEDIDHKVAAFPDESANSIMRNLGKEGDKTTEAIMAFFHQCLQLKATY